MYTVNDLSQYVGSLDPEKCTHIFQDGTWSTNIIDLFNRVDSLSYGVFLLIEVSDIQSVTWICNYSNIRRWNVMTYLYLNSMAVDVGA